MKAFPTAWLVFPEKLFFLPGIGRLVGDVVLLDRIRNIQRLLPADAHRCRVDERHRYVLWSGRNRTWKEARENVSWILRNILIKVIHFNVYYCSFHLRPLNRAPGALLATSWESFKREFCFRKKGKKFSFCTEKPKENHSFSFRFLYSKRKHHKQKMCFSEKFPSSGFEEVCFCRHETKQRAARAGVNLDAKSVYEISLLTHQCTQRIRYICDGFNGKELRPTHLAELLIHNMKALRISFVLRLKTVKQLKADQHICLWDWKVHRRD